MDEENVNKGSNSDKRETEINEINAYEKARNELESNLAEIDRRIAEIDAILAEVGYDEKNEVGQDDKG